LEVEVELELQRPTVSMVVLEAETLRVGKLDLDF
jgi:hypothetical protein